MRAKLKFLIRFVSLQTKIVPQYEYFETCHLSATFIISTLCNQHQKAFLYPNSLLVLLVAAFFPSQAASLMEMNWINICCKSINMSVSVKDGLCQQFSMCFLNRSIRVTWELARNTDSRNAWGPAICVLTGPAADSEACSVRTTTLDTLPYLMLISSLGTMNYLLFPSSQMGKQVQHRLRPVSPFPSSMWAQNGMDWDAVAVVQGNSRDIYVKEII